MNMCKICKEKKAEETHHINEQKDANCLNFINNTHIKKNEQYNLVPLCKECHNKQTYGNLKINGWIQTTSGLELDYEYTSKDIKKQKKKFNNLQIEIIQDFINTHPTLSNKMICQLLTKNNKIGKISTTILSKIKKNTY